MECTHRVSRRLLAMRWWWIAIVSFAMVLPVSAQQNRQGVCPGDPSCQTSPQSIPAAWKSVEDAMGWPGQMQPGGVIRFNMPRTNLQVAVNGFAIEPGFALTSWVTFHKGASATMVMGDLVLLETEVPAVMSAILQGGMQVTALHNHLLDAHPSLMYMHIHGSGDAAQMAQTVRHAVSLTSTPEPGTPTLPAKQPFNLDAEQLSGILGAAGKVNNGILQFSIPRPEKITEHGVEVPPAMGLASGINFQPTEDGRAMMTGDLVLLATEVDPVIQTLRQDGIVVTAIHNHMLDENPRLFFVHFWESGPPIMLAQGLRPALDKMGHR